MADNKKISELGRLTGLGGNELFVVASSGNNYSVSAQTLKENAQQGMVPVEEGKGLSSNDYTEEDKQKLAELPGTEQFGLPGFYSLANGTRNMSDAYRTSGLLALCRENDLVYRANAAGGASSVAFFAGDGSWISGRVSGAIEVTIPKTDFPADAVFFAVSTIKTYVDRAYYANGETIEAREGAVCDAIRASKFALFVDQWNVSWGAYGKYDPKNAPDAQHPFMGNDIWMTSAEAIIVLRESSGANYLCDYCHAYGKARTYLPIQNSRGNWGGSSTRAFSGCANLEVVDFAGSGYVPLSADTFAGCTKLRRILNGKLHVGNSAIFANLKALEELCVDRLTIDISFAGSPLLSLESIQYMVDNAANTTAITITLHADAYARLTDELIAQAAERQITFAST